MLHWSFSEQKLLPAESLTRFRLQQPRTCKICESHPLALCIQLNKQGKAFLEVQSRVKTSPEAGEQTVRLSHKLEPKET